MSNSKTALILGSMCLVGSFFTSFGLLFICSSIFFSTHFIIEIIESKVKKDLKPFHIVYDSTILIEKNTIIFALDYISAVEKFKKEFKGNYARIKTITLKEIYATN